MAKGVRSGQTRASGETTAEEVATEVSEELDQPTKVELPEERERTFRTPGFSRMRIDWKPDDRLVIEQARLAVEGRITRNFADAYQVMYEVYDVVRTPVADPETGEVRVDKYGLKEWQKNSTGTYVEDWTRLTQREKERFLFVITTRIFDWGQRAGDAWGEAMLAKAQFTERFAVAFDAPMSGTIDDRTAAGNIDAREERYFAIFLTWYSRRADALVRSMEMLSQRLRDSMQ